MQRITPPLQGRAMLVCPALVLNAPVAAQESTATIAGQVLDRSGAGIPLGAVDRQPEFRDSSLQSRGRHECLRYIACARFRQIQPGDCVCRHELYVLL